jgi:dTDP-glucose pyrophosphorylase
MIDVTALLIDDQASINDAILAIDEGAVQVAFVVDENGVLLGTITDGDVRRGLLKGLTLTDPASRIMKTPFRWVREGALPGEAREMMRRELLHQVPVLDPHGRIVELVLLDDLLTPQPRTNWVILMAGGRGQRLHPLTQSQPKPMVHVGGSPLLEAILAKCVGAGFQTFFISVNYLKQQIIDYFGDGSAWNVDVRYLEEEQPLGTAGPLGILPARPEEPVVVINGDVLSRVDLPGLLRFHREHGATATVCVRSYETQIPFGVVEVDGIYMQSFEEKPLLTHFVSAGVYVINPELVDLLPTGEPFDMPQLLALAKYRGFAIAVFPIHEYWLDVGDPSSLEQANEDWR